MKLTKIYIEAARKNRLEGHKIRKNIYLSLLVVALLSSAILYLILFVNPDRFWAVPVFFILFSINLFYIFSVLFIKKRRGFIATAVVTLIIFFKYLGGSSYYLYVCPAIGAFVIELFLTAKRR